ncbi:DHH family phosphoesterase [Trueperella pyogenes]|uniref:DHH family phosphoesterase n=1 Tax=Trueperella pyogenes TaxID=1661 RepID=UPI00345D612C
MTTTPSPPLPEALDIDELTSGPTGLELFNTIRERMGWTDEYLKEINDPSHPLLQDIDTMCAALEYLRVHQMPLVVIPDFDTDGICAGMILYAGLSELGLDMRLHVPDYHLGHEIQPQVIDAVVAAHPDAKAVITCDAGTNSTGALSRANELSLLTLVTDHHVEEGRSLAHVIVNPISHFDPSIVLIMVLLCAL